MFIWEYSVPSWKTTALRNFHTTGIPSVRGGVYTVGISYSKDFTESALSLSLS